MSAVLKCDNDIPEIQPLITIDQLLQWQQNPKETHFCRARTPLRKLKDGGLDAKRPRLLCCHDMRGGYLEDRFLQGTITADPTSSNSSHYTFLHWNTIDAFVYFSHHLVTIPPPGWTNAAHLHGVPVLGTFITEWQAGTAACTALLINDATAERAAHQLARIAEVFCFDGWIINIENELPKDLVPHLIHFLRCLTTAMHAAVPGSKVIWYDAVTTEGTLEWQNSLTLLNAPFFDACDGLWVNYTWEERTPLDIRKRLNHDADRGFDVYMGIDCFGRGTYGGGGLHCHTAVTAAASVGLSVALFACAWPYERHAMAMETINALNITDISGHGSGNGHGGTKEVARIAKDKGSDAGDTNDDHSKHSIKSMDKVALTSLHGSTKPGHHSPWHEIDEEFWSLIEQAWNVQRAVLCTLPFYSDFCVGTGRRVYQQGTVLFDKPWYNLSMQSMLPTLRFLHKKPESLVARLMHDASAVAPAYTGCAVVHIGGPVSSPVAVQLFPASVPMPSTGIKAKMAVAVGGSGVTVRLCFRIQKILDAEHYRRHHHSTQNNDRDDDNGIQNDDDYSYDETCSSGVDAEEVTIEVGAVEQTYGSRKLLVDSTFSVVQTSKITQSPFTVPTYDAAIGAAAGTEFSRAASPIPFPVPPSWSSWDAVVSPKDLPRWAMTSMHHAKFHSKTGGAVEHRARWHPAARIVSVDVIVASKVPGAECHCNVYVGGVGVRHADDDGISSVVPHHGDDRAGQTWTGNESKAMMGGYLRGLRAENPVVDVVVCTREMHDNGGSGDNKSVSATTHYKLSVLLSWSMPLEVSHCCILMRGGGVHDNSSNAEYKGCTVLGIATASWYQVHHAAVAKSSKAVRIIVAPVVGGVMQALRDAPYITIEL